VGIPPAQKLTTSSISFEKALRANPEHKKRINLHQNSVAAVIGHETSKNEQRQERGQSVKDPALYSDDILKASVAVQQIMAEFKNAESEQSRPMAVTKIMKQNGY
jgi:hypothetical protein